MHRHLDPLAPTREGGCKFLISAFQPHARESASPPLSPARPQTPPTGPHASAGLPMKLRHHSIRRPDGSRATWLLLHRLRRRHPPDCLPRFGTSNRDSSTCRPSNWLRQSACCAVSMSACSGTNPTISVPATTPYEPPLPFAPPQTRHGAASLHGSSHSSMPARVVGFSLYADRFDVREPAA